MVMDQGPEHTRGSKRGAEDAGQAPLAGEGAVNAERCDHPPPPAPMVVMPPDVPADGTVNVETAVNQAAQGAPTTSSSSSAMSSLTYYVESEALLSGSKGQLLDLVVPMVERTFRHQGLDVSLEDSRAIAELQVSLGGAAGVLETIRTPQEKRSHVKPEPRDYMPEVAAAEMARAGVGAHVAEMFSPLRA